MPRLALTLALVLALAAAHGPICVSPVRAAERETAPAAPGPIGQYDPEAVCAAPLADPVCAYKTWFFCRVADLDDMCDLVLGKGGVKQWEDRPWILPLSQLIAGPLAIYGYAFVGTRSVGAERFGKGQDKLKKQLLGAVEVMDTYADPQTPGVAYVGSEFYAEKKPGQWTLVGWSLDAEGGSAETECDDSKSKRMPLCKLRIQGLRSWAAQMREESKR